jgi:uncharacterized protein YjdB
MTPNSASLTVGQTFDFNVVNQSGIPVADCNLTWSTSSGASATVSPSGVVTAQASGVVLVQATAVVSKRTLTATAQVTIAAIPVASLTLSTPTATLTPGNAIRLVATPRDANGNILTGRAINWVSSDLSVATVSDTGLVVAASYGGEVTRTTTISALCEGRTATTTITVTPSPVASIAITPGTMSLSPGAAQQATAKLFDANGSALTGRTVTWTTAQPGVASVSSLGVVTAAGYAGTDTRFTVLTASSEGKTADANITVRPATVASLSVSPRNRVLYVGETVQLSTVMKDSEGTTLENRSPAWVSVTPAIGTVSASGMFSATALGETAVIVSIDGVVDTARIRVAPEATVTTEPRYPTNAFDAGYPADCQMGRSCSQPWSNINGVLADDGSVASVAMPRQDTGCWNCTISKWLYTNGYGFTLPEGSAIKGFTADVNGYSTGYCCALIEYAHLLKGSARSTEGKRQQLDGYGTVGSSSSLWGESWSVADVNSPGFGLGLTMKNIWDYSYTANVRYIRIAITYIPPSSALAY